MGTSSSNPGKADDDGDAPAKPEGPGVDNDRADKAHDTLEKSRATADDQPDDPDPS